MKPIPKSKCPSDPCHTLQYYANHSSFTNNSRFLFLEGEPHQLDSVVTISNVANLSLAGASSGPVRIVCTSTPSGFYVKEFIWLSMANMTISNCSGVQNVTVHLVAGSGVALNHITISYSSGSEGLRVLDVVGSFTITSSTFLAVQGGNVLVEYSHCESPSNFSIINSELNVVDLGLSFEVSCSDVHLVITNVSFEKGSKKASGLGLSINYNVLTNNSVFVDKSTLGITVTICLDSDCNEDYLHSSSNFVQITRSTVYYGALFGFGDGAPTKDCTIIIEDTVFSYVSLFALGYNSSKNGTAPQAVLHNVTLIANIEYDPSVPSIYLAYGVVTFVNCTFENNSESAIQTYKSEIIFQGYNVFKNNSALLGGGIVLISTRIHLRSHAHILFENNHANYVGGAMYINSAELDPCFFTLDSQSTDVEVSFIDNTADFAGSSLYGIMAKCCTLYHAENSQMYLIKTSNSDEHPSAVALDPYDVCLCDDGKHLARLFWLQQGQQH